MWLRNQLKKIKYLQFVWRVLKNAVYKSKGYEFRIKGINSKFYLPYIMTDDIQKEILYKKNYFERNDLDFVFKEWHDGIIGKALSEGAALDIGANIGNHTLYYLNECNAKFVHSFEPMNDTFDILKKNVEINHLESRTHLYNIGVGCKQGFASVSKCIDKNTGYTQLTPSESEEGIKIVSIDELNILERVTFVKIDVEGFELEVVKGMQSLLKRDKPFIMMELWHTNFDVTIGLLKDLGYQFEVIDEYPTARDCLFYVS